MAAGAGPAAAVSEESLSRATRSVVSIMPVFPADRAFGEEPEGSGVVVLRGHHVLTALHVIDGAERILVRSHDGEIVEASLAAREPLTDLALLETEAGFQPAEMGEDVSLGQEVCAIGNAFGLGLSTTCGVVSAAHRAGIGFNPVEDFVQTDAAVNPGASGGALVDAEGRVVGILSAIFTKTSDANIGMNFAVSAPLASRVVADLVAAGRLRLPSTGLRLVDEPPRGDTGRQSARVMRVAPNSPAAGAGLRRGDLILAVDTRRILAAADFVSAIARLDPAASVELTLERDGRVLRHTLNMAENVGSSRASEQAQ